MKQVTLGLTGASGMPYGFRLLECLLQSGVDVNLLFSQAAQVVAKTEMEFKLAGSSQEIQAALEVQYSALPGQLHVYGEKQWFAPIASGSSVADAMVICPCTGGTLASVAQGLSDNLLERAADVTIKEQKKLIIVPREMPFSTIHLENMLRLSRMGVVVMPASPAYYHHPVQISDLVDFVVARILDHLGIAQDLVPKWGE